MAVELGDLERLASRAIDGSEGPAALRQFVTENRFDAVRASVTWQGSGENRWGRVERFGANYVANLYQRLERDEVAAAS